MKNIMRAALAASTALLVAQAHAGVVINTPGGASVGVQDGGALGAAEPTGGPFTGIAFTGVGDGITPGCLCEGWGASGNGVYGQSGNANGGNVNITILPFVGVAGVSGVSTVQVGGGGPLVTQAYGLSASQYLVRDTVTLTNMTGALMTDVRYSRSMDWDIPPTTFREDVTIQRNGSTKLLYSNDNGFAAPNPLVNPAALRAGTTNTDFVDNGPADHGAFFTFGFGDLAIGASTTFDIFYGAAPSEALALGALGAVAAEVYSFGQQSGDPTGGTPATYIFGFAGVGGTAVTVPEPSGIALMLTAFGIAGAVGRKAQGRKQA